MWARMLQPARAQRDARGGGRRDRRVRRAARRPRQVALRGPRRSGRRSAARSRRRAAAAAPRGTGTSWLRAWAAPSATCRRRTCRTAGRTTGRSSCCCSSAGCSGSLAAWLAFAQRRSGGLRGPLPAAVAFGVLFTVPAVQVEGGTPVVAGDRARGPALRVPAPRARRAPRRGHGAGRRRGRRPRRRRRGAAARRRPAAPRPRGAGQRAGARSRPAVLVEPRLRRAALAAHRPRGAAHQGEDGELLEGREPRRTSTGCAGWRPASSARRSRRRA